MAMYVHPHYITENINGDICTSDIGKHAVVVVDGLGNYRFSYEGHERNFSPYGICTDTNGRILVCDYKEVVHRLDQDGHSCNIYSQGMI